MKKKTLNSIPKLPTAVQVTWYVCRGLLFIWGAVMLLTGYTTEFLEAVFAIIFTFLWDLFQLLGGKTFITLFPHRVQTMLNLLICFGVVVGKGLEAQSGACRNVRSCVFRNAPDRLGVLRIHNGQALRS